MKKKILVEFDLKNTSCPTENNKCVKKIIILNYVLVTVCIIMCK